MRLVALKGVQIRASVLDQMLKMSVEAHPCEVGGVLLGPTKTPHPTVTILIGPGPESDATTTAFEPDYAYQQAELDRLFREHHGEIAYLGDWHSHPAGRCEPSPRDLRAMMSIRDAREARCPKPIMIISGGQDGRTTKAFVFATANELVEVGLRRVD
jgi:integrative and conjugative element protein (TIGR02256 family)